MTFVLFHDMNIPKKKGAIMTKLCKITVKHGIKSIKEFNLYRQRKFACRNKIAFTLAEVLIVIGIIGVVAAITIPTLINTISPKAKEAQTKTIEARLLDGLNRYNAMEDGLSKPYETTKEFLEGLSKYYKMNAICDSDEITTCIPYAKISYEVGEVTDKIIRSVNVATLTENSKMMSAKISDNYLPPASFITAQGTPVVIAFKKGCIWDNGTAMKDIRDSGCIALMYDKNGVNLPNKMGDDIESIGLSVAVAGLRTINGVKVMEKAFVPTKGLTYAQCMAETTQEKQAEYLEVGNETAITGCYYNNDTWAYGMKYCKEKGYHLPTTGETYKLVLGLFYITVNGEKVHPSDNLFSGYTYEKELANTIGFGDSGNFRLGKQYSNYGSYFAGYNAFGLTVYSGTNRDGGVLSILCID